MFSVSFSFLASASLAKAQETRSNITLGSSLSPTANPSSWPSPSGLYAFGFYPQGQGYVVGVFLTGIPPRTVIWTANRDDPPVSAGATLLFTNDGRLILRSSQGQETSITSATGSAYSATMLDSGNFVLYDPKGSVLWESFDYPTDTLLPTQRLLAGQQIISSISATNHSTGIFRVKMQNGGNLVQYPVNTPDTAPYSYYATSAGGFGDNVSLNFDVDGRLFLLNSTGYVIMNITSGGLPMNGMIYICKIDSDGLMKLCSYDLNQRGDWSVVWRSRSDDCDPKGLCGLNGFCVNNDQQANCQCLPGFDFVEPGNGAAGCERNFSAESCKAGDASASYIIQAVDYTQWEDDSYSVVSSTDKDGCKQACLEDCNCEAALYNGGNCNKQRLPLRYGRRLVTDPTSALIKVGIAKPFNTNQNKEITRMDILFLSLSLLAFGFVMMAISLVLICKNNVWSYQRIRKKIEVGLAKDQAPRLFTYAELELVTDSFKEQIGRGAFGTVYKGLIGEKMVAVKRLDKRLAEGEREFQTEVEVIGRTHHRNLVRLLGYCMEGTNRLLVYEYMSNGSLANVLFDSLESRPFWEERMEIARDIARGVLYLHEECETQIIHCDIKPQNILMGENSAKISDFGLAKLLNADQTRTFTGIRGTRGYVAPEWHRNQPVTVKADVYSFGIMLLEIICCRKSLELEFPEREAILEEWVCECFWNGGIEKLTGDEKVDEDELKAAIKVALWCVSDDPLLRPTMKRVLLMLEGSTQIPMPPIPSSSIFTDKSFVVNAQQIDVYNAGESTPL